MVITDKITIAIKGALKVFQDFGGFIASSASFSKSAEDVKAISELDNELVSFYDNYPIQYESLTQQFHFCREIAGRRVFMVIRARKKFTIFPEQNRFYERREYFYFGLEEPIDITDFISSLPAMVEYNAKQLGELNSFSIQPISGEPQTSVAGTILQAILEKNILLLKTNLESSDTVSKLIIAGIYAFPENYKKYLGFAFNVKSGSSLVNSHIHVASSLDENASDISLLQKKSGLPAHLEAFSESLFKGTLPYDDTEIGLLRISLDRNTISELLKYHLLHFSIDNYPGRGPANTHVILRESKKYIELFLSKSFIANSYINSRIIKIYLFWHHQLLLDEPLFLFFWQTLIKAEANPQQFYKHPEVKQSVEGFIDQAFRNTESFVQIESTYQALAQIPSPDTRLSLLDEIKIRYIRSATSYEYDEVEAIKTYTTGLSKKGDFGFSKNMFSKVDIRKHANRLSSEEAFTFLRGNFSELPANSLQQLISQTGLANLYNLLKAKSNKVLMHNRDFLSVLNLKIGEETDLASIISWELLFREHGSNTTFDFNGYLAKQAERIYSSNDYYSFDSFCRTLILHRNFFPAGAVHAALDRVLEARQSQSVNFYLPALQVAKEYNLKLKIPIDTSRALSDPFGVITLFKEHINYISNEEVVNELINITIHHMGESEDAAENIISLLQSQSDLIQTNQTLFTEVIEKKYSRSDPEAKQALLIAIFENTLKSKENAFLKADSKLYEQMKILVPTNGGFVRALYQILKKLKRSSGPGMDTLVDLAGIIIDNYFAAFSNANYFRKMKNNIAIISKNTVKVVLLLCLFTIAGTGGCFYFYRKTNSLSMKLEAQGKLLDSLKNEIKKIKDFNGSPVTGEINSPNEILPLNPTPNGELNENDVRVMSRQNLRGRAIADVVSVILDINKNDIARLYKDQVQAYTRELLARNPNCFDSQNCICDTVFHIPAYKNPN